MTNLIEDRELNITGNTISDEEEETRSPQEALKEIESAWLNEKFAPEILPHKMELVELIIDQVDYFEERLKGLDKRDLRYDIHSMELSRIRFIISSYIRIRLDKIENFVYYILEQEEQRGSNRYLTDKELRFAREYKNSVEELFNNMVLQHLPQAYKSLTQITKPKPNLNSHVLFKVIKHIPNFAVRDLDGVYERNMTAGTQYIMAYQSIAHLVQNGTVQLI